MNMRSLLATATLMLLTGPAFATFGVGTSVPEPSTWALFAVGAVALGIARSRRKK